MDESRIARKMPDSGDENYFVEVDEVNPIGKSPNACLTQNPAHSLEPSRIRFDCSDRERDFFQEVCPETSALLFIPGVS